MSLRPLLVLPCCLIASAQDGQFAVSRAKAAPSVLQPMDASLRRAPYLDPKRPLEQRVEDLFARLKPEEKVALIHGSGGFADFAGLPRLGLPTLVMTDGPQGVRTSVPTTGFPSGIALAATWRRPGARTWRSGWARCWAGRHGPQATASSWGRG